jgi:hypothetical protein
MITKIDVAQAQLNSAIRLFFENIDHLSAYTLAIASREITDDLLEKKRDEVFQREAARLGDPMKVRGSYREEYRDRIKREHYKDSLKLANRVQNLLKHANRDPDSEIDDLDPKGLAHNIMFSIWNFRLLTNRITNGMRIFVCWFYAAHPNLTTLPDDPLSDAIRQSQQACPADPYDSALFEALHASLVNPRLA